MRLPSNFWPATDIGRGMLMFSQHFAEMLEQTTFESFRVYSLDTIARLDEALALINDIVAKRVPEAALKAAIDELRWSLRRDPIAESLASTSLAAFEQCAKDQQSKLSLLKAHIIILQKLLAPTYKSSLEAALLECIDNARKRTSLRVLTAFYCSHLLTSGYSRSYISVLIQSSFFEKDMKRVSKRTLAAFFRNFNGKEKSFGVYTDVAKDFAYHLSSLDFEILSPRTTPRDVIAAFETQPDRILHEREVALDPYGAMLKVQQTLSSIRAMTYLSPYGIICEWHEDMYVKLARAKGGIRWPMSTVAFDRENKKSRPSGRRLRRTRTTAKRVLTSFDADSTKRLLSSINTAALARSSQNMENQLISMWSAIEVLLSEPEGSVRITHFIELMTPLICLGHVRRQITTFYNELTVSYRKRLQDVLKQAGPDDLPRIALAATIMLPNPILQRQLTSVVADNPLALQRLHHAQKSFCNHEAIFKSIEAHEDRVRWQLSRIYRVRNNLVHAGRSPRNIDSLIMNTTDYFRAAVAAIIGKANKENHESSIDQTIAEIGIDYTAFKKFFKERNEPLTMAGVKMLVL